METSGAIEDDDLRPFKFSVHVPITSAPRGPWSAEYVWVEVRRDVHLFFPN